MKKIIENLLKLQTLESAESDKAAKPSQIAALRAEIPLQILGHYDRLVARGKKGVAVIRHQVCSACHVQVPRNAELILMHGQDIQICENCGRYLCLPEHEQPAVVPQKKAKQPRKPKAALQTA
jgi:predicted  nucleic acid-binding Zn-ribbon protein